MGENRVNIKPYAAYTIKLIKNVLKNGEPEAMPEDIDFDLLYRFASSHNVANIIYLGLVNAGVDRKLLGQFEAAYNYAIAVDAAQQYYLETISDAFEENGIMHLAMKGAVLKQLYPSSDLRKSGDIDMYFDNADSEKVKSIMEKIGFETLEYGEQHIHDKYLIDGKILVEMHRALMSEKYFEWGAMCRDIAHNLVLDAGYEYRYKMTDEDYYLYMTAHMAKHMKYGGIGIRFIIDIWVYLNKYYEKLNWEYIARKLREGNLYKFENLCRRLSNIWMEGGECEKELDELENYIISNGLFGNAKQYVVSEYVNNIGVGKPSAGLKLKRYTDAFFLPFKAMRGKYPILKKLPILLPFCWLHRGISCCIFNKEKLISFNERYSDISREQIEKMAEFKRKIGL